MGRLGGLIGGTGGEILSTPTNHRITTRWYPNDKDKPMSQSFADGVEISVGHRIGRLLDLAVLPDATKMDSFLEIVTLQNKTIGCYRESTGYINAKPTRHGRRGDKQLRIQINEEQRDKKCVERRGRVGDY